jgi:hypothetical protein
MPLGKFTAAKAKQIRQKREEEAELEELSMNVILDDDAKKQRRQSAHVRYRVP